MTDIDSAWKAGVMSGAAILIGFFVLITTWRALRFLFRKIKSQIAPQRKSPDHNTNQGRWFMNRTQRRILISTSTIIMLMLMFPPFHIIGGGGQVVGAGYGFILFPPGQSDSLVHQATVDVPLLLAQWIGISLFCAGMVLAFKKRTIEQEVDEMVFAR